MKGKTVKYWLLALAAILVSPLSAQASLIGDSVGCSLTPGQAACAPASATVSAGAEFTLVLGPDNLFSVDVGSMSVTFTEVDLLPFGFTSDVFVLSDLDFSGAPGGITGVSLSVNGTIAGITASDLSFTPDSLTINFSGISYGGGDSGSFTVTFETGAASVPGPSSLALLGLVGLAGLGVARVSSRRRPVR